MRSYTILFHRDAVSEIHLVDVPDLLGVSMSNSAAMAPMRSIKEP
jgi:hypothetical protein